MSTRPLYQIADLVVGSENRADRLQSAAAGEFMTNLQGLALMGSGLRVGRTSVANQVKGNRSNVNLRRRIFALTTLILMFSARVYSEPKNSANAAPVQAFLGR